MKSRAHKYFRLLQQGHQVSKSFLLCTKNSANQTNHNARKNLRWVQIIYCQHSLLWKSPATGVLTIYLGKSNILVGKSKLMVHAIPFGKLQKHQFFSSFQSVQLIWMYLVAGSYPTMSNSIALCLRTEFPPGCFV